MNPNWEHKKKVFLSALKMYGDGKECLENIMNVIIKELVGDFQQHMEQPFDLKQPIQLALLNTLSLLVCIFKHCSSLKTGVLKGDLKYNNTITTLKQCYDVSHPF